MIATHPWLPVLYLPDLGEDKLHIFSIGDDGTLTNLTEYHVPLAHGPRHVAISQDGQWLYLLMELAAKLRVLSIDTETGLLTQVGEE